MSEPVLLVFNKENVLIHVGDPRIFSVEDIDDYIEYGYTLTTTTIDEYRKKNMTLYETKVFIDINVIATT